MLGWIALYQGVAISSNLNIGLRHLLPVFPFTFMLVCREMSRWLTLPQSPGLQLSIRGGLPWVMIAVLLLWHRASVLRVYPSFLAYFNEAVGGPARGGDYVMDFDWGQDLERLRDFVEARQIEKIAVHYFGTSSPIYELGEKFIPWRPALGPPQGWLAVSAAILHVAQGQWDPTLGHPAAESYQWLRSKQPVAIIGYTIYVFHF